ncbi:uncharacterized protein ACHE_61016S [Aspergillus chevalieri]|uniref:Zn(2)-C6 fungal-type domain-containing protein n=1 Tax=Aspergillus chevalieri TaxID=182096 RepID=A0A7R7ZQL6_ASPCH|nr:uncharacterized protein ACHE_61016S [Aspergillus chevalieri]BCR91130.1 hypothetical protein ACHE_61016S [Aspergillus chevalieri]
MPRRAHKKSRNGCVECKRRHVKCDERRPTCVNCSISERHCEYLAEPTPAATRAQTEASLTARSSPAVASSAGSVPASTREEDFPSANMLHFELLYHLSTETIPSVELNSEQIKIPVSELFRVCVSAPYAMNEALALAALHLAAVSSPDKKDFYRTHAGYLQTKALSMFNAMKPEVNAETSGAIFLFSVMLGNHLLSDALVFRDTDFNNFMEKLSQSIHLFRGVRVVAGLSFHILAETPLSPMLRYNKMPSDRDGFLGPECQRLLDLVTSARLGQSITDCYKDAIENLQLASNSANSDPGFMSKSPIAAWPVRVSDEYFDALKARRPEALIIFAHYAVLLHSIRDSWLFCDSGLFLIESINAFLGPGWEEWMAFPNSVLDTGSAHFSR